MPETTTQTARAALLTDLERLIRAEIPVTEHMDVRVQRRDATGLWVAMPLAPNRNPHATAFAGSLNTLCTVAGWGMTYLLMQEYGLAGTIVIRRSSIKYHEPIETTTVAARCRVVAEVDRSHFVEMLTEKGQAKLDHFVEITGQSEDRPAVLFAGSYVVTAASQG
ncbi:putative thioesterase [Pseudobythopirellula maris]|uniref:Putative thioesterase n=1 Tax=Pseudobythopirellula maris TaxID=2527991 RepID=A0A5C5ZN77_9BACT|nr:YiiD C-terminal domain-containing protein [Pseudobythopirellula maris]TWT88525.1 putative thioesterase [Pseudobythopirellula maris]